MGEEIFWAIIAEGGIKFPPPTVTEVPVKEVTIDFSGNDNTRLENYIKTGIKHTDVYDKLKEVANAKQFSNLWNYLITKDSERTLLGFKFNQLPWCCGISEIGDLIFDLDAYEEDKRSIIYNLLIDFLRLYSHANMASLSGAYSIINYFIDTDFNKFLQERNDILCIKRFTNPKTSATLDTFIFDNKII